MLLNYLTIKIARVIIVYLDIFYIKKYNKDISRNSEIISSASFCNAKEADDMLCLSLIHI